MMKTPPATHEEIAACAQKIWHDRGQPSGSDIAIWLEAEGALHAGSHEGIAPAASPDAVAAKASVKKNAARSPQQQHGKNAPQPAPTESGKPLWDKPHSS